MRDPPPTIADSIPTRPTTFEVGEHKLVVTKLQERRWTVAVDGRPYERTYDTQADAWEAGVREATRLDALRGK